MCCPGSRTSIRTASNVTTRCPAHDDTRNSLSIGEDEDGTVLLHCFVGCTTEHIVAAIGLSLADLFPPNRKARDLPGVTVERYALAKRLPPAFLKERFKLKTVRRKGQFCVEMPAFDEDGQRVATNYRMKLTKTDGIDDRFQRAKGDAAIPYGLWRLAEARERGYLILVEGESDVHTLDLPRRTRPWGRGSQQLEGGARCPCPRGHRDDLPRRGTRSRRGGPQDDDRAVIDPTTGADHRPRGFQRSLGTPL